MYVRVTRTITSPLVLTQILWFSISILEFQGYYILQLSKYGIIQVYTVLPYVLL